MSDFDAKHRKLFAAIAALDLFCQNRISVFAFREWWVANWEV